MKKLISLFLGCCCSLAVAGVAFAQEPVEQQSTSKKTKRAPEKAQTTEAQPRANAAEPQEKHANEPAAMKQHGATNERSTTSEAAGAEKSRKPQVGRESATESKPNVATKSTGEATNEPGAGKNKRAQARGEA